MRKIHGFTLLEVLIAVLVLGVGLLGLAQLQTTGLQNTHSANQRTVATQLAYEMTDRIRANKAGYLSGSYNKPTIGTVADCTATDCNTSAMAIYDIDQWNTALADNLVGGHGIVCLDNTPNDGTGDADDNGTLTSTEDACDNTTSATMGANIYVVKVWWQDDRDAASPIKRFVVPFVP
ncbi:MAG: type IV pilus modification protein PilV [Arenicellales bacterium]